MTSTTAQHLALNALAPARPKPCMPTGPTLLQGRPYVPSHKTDVAATWRRFATKGAA